ncbi:MAG TPA: LysM peptidoglycan-binding domain-containing protein, partial [Chitinophagales bacterium]|nr:LysM peptidoglycan-binding domain-containing protein [Chitinophagales bacterium]
CNKYKVEMTEVIVLNRIGTSGYTLSEGEILTIPLYAKKPLIDISRLKVSDDGYITHIVRQGETLFSISRNYNGVTPQMLREKNNLKSDALRINQQLLIPQAINSKAVLKEMKAVAGAGQAAAGTADFASSGSDKRTLADLEKKYKASETTAASLEVSRGIATWLDNGDAENQKNYFALHKYAPIGTVMRVRNLMNNRVAHVKVIGKLPDNDENKSIIIKVSGATAQQLHVLDEKFLVELTIPEAGVLAP